MKCPICSLPEEWHDDGDCPNYRQAARIMFGGDIGPTDLREYNDPNVVFDVRFIPGRKKRWASIKSHVNAYGRRVNEALDYFDTKHDAIASLEQYRGVGKILPG